jgi:hypothetical protein
MVPRHVGTTDLREKSMEYFQVNDKVRIFMYKKCFKYSHKYVTFFLEICQIYASSLLFMYLMYFISMVLR